MPRRQRLVSLSLCLALPLALLMWFGPQPSERGETVLLTRSQALADLIQLKADVAALHPGDSLDQWRSEFDVSVAQLDWPERVPLRQLAWEAQRQLARLRDSHTRLNTYAVLSNPLYAGVSVLPLRGLEAGEHAVRVSDHDRERLNLPDDIPFLVAIDRKPIDGLTRSLADALSGESERLRRREALDNLAVLLWLRDGVKPSFELELSDGEGERRRVRVRAEPWRSTVGASGVPVLGFAEQGLTLKIPSFDEHRVPGLRASLQDAISKIRTRRPHRVVLDLRGNSGGDASIAYRLLRELSAQPFRLGSKRWRYGHGYRDAMLRYGLQQRGLPSWLRHGLQLEWFAPAPVGRFVDGEWLEVPGQMIEPSTSAWAGQLDILVDRYTYSAAVDLAATVQDNRLGCVHGEETGGHASYFSEIAPIALQNSGLALQISSARWTRMDVSRPPGGVTPDLSCAWTSEAVL